nr:peptide chain release factor N(5)-glutamine methyltransferase [candidate division Zixibacteria bacterium]
MKTAEEKLRQAGIESAAVEIEIILETLLDVERIDIYLHGERLIDNTVLEKFNRIVDQRTTRRPLQYILGEAYFYGRKFLVSDDVMIPTPETELLCQLAIGYVNNEAMETAEILDLGTGSGVIAVTITAELAGAYVTAVDISRAALMMARKNAAIHALDSRIKFAVSDLFSGILTDEKYDLILSNPPYIAEKEYDTLPPEVLADPRQALVSGPEGLDLIKRLIDKAPDHLNPNGRLMFEIGYDQGKKIAKLTADDSRYRSLSIIKDLNDIDRVVILSV